MRKHAKHHRPSYVFILLIALTLATGALNGHTANAASKALTTKNTFATPLQNNEDKIKQIDKLLTISKDILEKKSKLVEKAQADAKLTQESKDKLNAEIQQMKDDIAELSDMFVRINKYALNASGNSYATGNCTWYVKSKRPDIANFWGNANNWYYQAKLQGWNVGTKAKVGAVATTTDGSMGHVAYVEKVSRNGQTVTISEMNYSGYNVVSWRTVSASEFNYIYELD